jgi:putative heme-binding domain-containing protein
MRLTLINSLLGWSLIVSPLLICTAITRSGPATAPVDDPMSDDPAVERRLLKLAEGFDIQLYASEPDIINPVTMNFDPQGRLWVLCLPSYPQVLPGQEPRDFITVLDPPDETGHAAKTHTFATGLSVPTGMIPGDGGAYVGQADMLFHLKDIDGDGKADQRRLLLSGFGTQDTHHTINTFRWGPDGRLYFNQGLYILSSVETPYGLRRHFGGAIWQLQTDSLALEIYDRSILPCNSWGHVFDDWGRSFVSSAWVADINRVLPETPLNNSDEPDFVPPLPMTKLAGDRHSGLDRVTGRHFPADWQGDLVSGNFQSQQVNRFAVEEGAERLSARQLAPLVISHHRKFRPVDVKMGPDGALYIADWYNLIIQHNQVDFRDPRRGHTQGRIWRITCKGRPLLTPPDLRVATAQVLDHLKDPEQWTRDKVRRTLAERDHKEVAAALAKWVANISTEDPAAEHHLLEALWSYQTIDVVEPDLLRRLLRAKDPRARGAATTVLGYWQDHLPDTLALLAAQVRDENIQVRLSAVLAAQRIPSAGAFAVALNALDQRTDDMLTFELRKTALVLQRYWYPPFQSGKLSLNDNARQISFALIAIRSPEGVLKLIELFKAGKISHEHQPELLTAVAATGNAEQLTTVLDAAVATDEALGVSDRAHILDALADAARGRKVLPQSDLARIAPLLSRDDALGLSAIRLAGAWHVESLRDRLRQFSEDPNANPQQRRASMTALVEIGSDASGRYLTELAASDKPLVVRTDAVMALAEIDLTEASRAAASLLQTCGPADAAPLFVAFLRRNGGSDALADAMKDRKPTPDVARVGLRELGAAGMAPSRLAAVLQSAAQVTTVKRKATPQTIKHLLDLAATRGDPARGEKLYRSATLACMRCHAIAGAGGNVGPDLAAIGSTAQPDFLIEHILQPGKRVKDGYTALAVDTKKGDFFTGVQLRDTADTLVLRDATHDEIVIPKNTIKRKRPIGTLMPSGLADALSDSELADLVRFLSELGKPGPFNAGHANVARRWWMLNQVPASADPEIRGRMLRDERTVWTRQFTNVAGEVPLMEAAIGPDKSVAILRCVLDVQSAGKVELAINDTEGLELWLDATVLQPQTRLSVDLTTGRHTLDVWIKLPTRKSPALRCELLDVPGSPARAPAPARARAEWAAN